MITYFFLHFFRTDGLRHGVTVVALAAYRPKSGRPIPANNARQRGVGMGTIGVAQAGDLPAVYVLKRILGLARPIQRTKLS